MSRVDGGLYPAEATELCGIRPVRTIGGWRRVAMAVGVRNHFRSTSWETHRFAQTQQLIHSGARSLKPLQCSQLSWPLKLSSGGTDEEVSAEIPAHWWNNGRSKALTPQMPGCHLTCAGLTTFCSRLRARSDGHRGIDGCAVLSEHDSWRITPNSRALQSPDAVGTIRDARSRSPRLWSLWSGSCPAAKQARGGAKTCIGSMWLVPFDSC